MCLNVFKHLPPHLYTRPLFLRRAQKPLQNHNEENQSVAPWFLSQRCRTIPDSDMWSCDLSSTSLPAPGGLKLCTEGLRYHSRLPTTTHLGPKSTAPRPFHRRGWDCMPNWCRRPCYLTSRLWLKPDHQEMHSGIQVQSWCKEYSAVRIEAWI